jgi:membrane protein
MKQIKSTWYLLKETVQSFIDDEGMKLSASLSYYTIFSIAPVIVIVISVTGLVFGEDAVAGRIYYQIKSLIGPDAALQIQNIIANVQLQDRGFAGTIAGVVILLFGATGVFTEIQSSINFIWSIKAKPKRGIIKYIINRLLSFSLIMSIGFILMVSLLVNSVVDVLYDKLEHLLNIGSLNILYAVNMLLIFIIITTLFTVIFKVLPDAYIRWKDAMVGSSFTAILFIIGKFIIGLYIGNSKLGITYGTAASIIVILVWVYYTSIILYMGAEFTKTYARRKGGGIIPNEQAVYIIKTESIEMPTPITSEEINPQSNYQSE